MGLDIYAGTLTRYYTQNWKNVAQQWAEANGYTFTRVAPNGEPEAVDVISAEEIQEEAVRWRDKILRAIAPEGQGPFLLGRRMARSPTTPISRTGTR